MEQTKQEPQRIEVTAINISFMNLVFLIFRATLAAIPAALMVVLVGTILSGVLQGILVGHR